MNLLPKDEDFFYLFESHAQILCRASKLFLSGLADGYDGVCRIEKDMSRIEDDGDRVVHDIFSHLRSTSSRPSIPKTFSPSPPGSTTFWTVLKTSRTGSSLIG